MPNETTYNFLVWEDISNLPLPDEVKAITKDIPWSEFIWHTGNLPVPYAVYSMTGGKTLYLQELPDGQPMVQKQEFTGDIWFCAYFVAPDNGDSNYFVGFKATILKGELVEVVLDKVQSQSNKEYQEAKDKEAIAITKLQKRNNSFWFRWLYRPWFFTVRGIAWVLLAMVHAVRYIILRITMWLTPL